MMVKGYALWTFSFWLIVLMGPCLAHENQVFPLNRNNSLVRDKFCIDIDQSMSTIMRAANKELSTVEQLWRKLELLERDAHEADLQQLIKGMSEAYKNLINIVLGALYINFGKYSWMKDWSRFHDLLEGFDWTFNETLCDSPCGVRLDADLDTKIALNTMSTRWKYKYRMHFLIRSPRYKLDNGVFFPGGARLVLGRLFFSFGHEFAHVLNEYNRTYVPEVNENSPYFARTQFELFGSGPVAIGACLGFDVLVGAFILKGGPDKYPLINLAGVIGFLSFLSVAFLRCNNMQKEYAADDAALQLIPKSMHYGGVVVFAEFICQEHLFHMKKVALSKFQEACSYIKDRFREFMNTSYNIHPLPSKRLLRCVYMIVESTPLQERQAIIDDLARTAIEALENCFNQYGSIMDVQDARAKSQDSLVAVFNEVCHHFKLTKPFCLSSQA